MDMQKIGSYLKGLRKEKGLTQEQLAEMIGVSDRTVSRWENAYNIPDLSILIQIADFYDVEIKEILDGESMEGTMDKELKETLTKVADYSKYEKEQAEKSGNVAFGIMYITCAAAIVLQLIMNISLSYVAGETIVLILGGVTYIVLTARQGVYEAGTGKKRTLMNDGILSIAIAAIFTILYVVIIQRLSSNGTQVTLAAGMFFVGISVLCFLVLRVIVVINSRKKKQ